jgi:hypothetical protein
MNNISAAVRKALLAKQQQRQLASILLRRAQQHQQQLRSYATALKPSPDSPDDPNFYNDKEFLESQEHLRGKIIEKVPKREIFLAKLCGAFGALWFLFFMRDEGAILFVCIALYYAACAHAHVSARGAAEPEQARRLPAASGSPRAIL